MWILSRQDLKRTSLFELILQLLCSPNPTMYGMLDMPHCFALNPITILWKNQNVRIFSLFFSSITWGNMIIKDVFGVLKKSCIVGLISKSAPNGSECYWVAVTQFGYNCQKVINYSYLEWTRQFGLLYVSTGHFESFGWLATIKKWNLGKLLWVPHCTTLDQIWSFFQIL